MPTFSRADVAKHKTAETGIWVTFKDGVYDVTEFVDKHPGGNKILLAAGGAVDSFWVVYQQHAHSHVHEILAKYRIGSLDAKEAAAAQSAAAAVGDPYARDPPRSPFMHAHSAKPYNGEPPGQLLVDHYITPVDLLFVRNHLPVPHIDPATHRLAVEVRRPGCEVETMSYSLADLQTRFPQGKVVSVITCSGNRRGDMAAAKEARGLSWAAGAIGNVEWTGVWLRDVLAHAGVRESDLPAGAGPSSGSAGAGAGGRGGEPSGWLRHVHFEGCDTDPAAGTNYAASIPADKALDPRADVLLAWALNGEPIPADHGAPLRAVVPGVTGARQVKWLGKVIADAEESSSLWQVKDYKLFPPTMDWNNVDFSSMPAMQEMPVQSAIAEPAPGAALVADRDGTIAVKGWAWSGGGRGITRVDVSADGGKSWTVADITARPEDPTPSMSRSWGWTLWTAFVPVTPPAAGAAAGATAAGAAGERSVDVELVVKAVDAACNSQPESPLAIWNYRGLANNAWHRVPVKVKPAPPLPA